MADRSSRRPLEAGAEPIPAVPVRLLRALRVGMVIARCVLTSVLGGYRGGGVRPAAARGLGMAFMELGPTFIKIGQLISANPAIFPAFMIESFAHCQDQCSPEPFEGVRRTVEGELGAPIEHLFDEFESAAMASASIAEVHSARLVDGSNVVVKVQRPNLAPLLGADLALMEAVARLVVRLLPRYKVTNPVGAVKDFRTTLGEELAFRLEARRMKELSRVFGGWPIVIPRVYDDLTRDKVLTMERVYGVKINDLDELDRRGHDRRALAELLISSLLYSALQKGVFHGDGHPGNLVVLDDGRLGIFDFGIVGRIADEDRVQVSRFFRGLILMRFDVMASALMTLADLSEADLPAAIADMEAMSSSLFTSEGSIKLAEIDHIGLLNNFLVIANKHGLIIPTDLILLFKQLMYLNGLANLLWPGLDVFEGDRFFNYFAPDDGMAV